MAGKFIKKENLSKMVNLQKCTIVDHILVVIRQGFDSNWPYEWRDKNDTKMEQKYLFNIEYLCINYFKIAFIYWLKTVGITHWYCINPARYLQNGAQLPIFALNCPDSCNCFKLISSRLKLN